MRIINDLLSRKLEDNENIKSFSQNIFVRLFQKEIHLRTEAAIGEKRKKQKETSTNHS